MRPSPATRHALRTKRRAGAASSLTGHTIRTRALWEEYVAATMAAEVLPVRVIGAGLRAAAAVLGADGAAVVSVTVAGPAVQAATCAVPSAVLSRAPDAMLSPCVADAVLAWPVPHRLGPPNVLLFWRGGSGQDWAGDGRVIAASFAHRVGALLEQDAIQGELLHQARTDPLTGLLNRRAFLEDLDRRLARAQTVEGSGVLIVLDVDGLQRHVEQYGPEAGDGVLAATATLLRHTFRPADLLARLRGDEFAVWLDGADVLTAAERADELCGTLPDAAACVLPEAAGPVTVSAGIAVADSTLGDLGELLRRAEAAMSVAKGTGGGTWQVDAGGLPRPRPRA